VSLLGQWNHRELLRPVIRIPLLQLDRDSMMSDPSRHQPEDGDHHGDLEDTAQASRLDEHLDEGKQSQQQQPDRVQEPPCRLRVPPPHFMDDPPRRN